ncbi:NUDIX domain-containing protein [Actinoplanes oblitus]|uniref:NUDIX domain-containing protein n=1 Tax=Actinoplanes oblitus TaxID=3040509 RepID=A0ABY8W8A8_9ACTN|nr:NUDIX domain-containing protein [Actinoplanes oblitus]WIM92624.1 NUDIX domain-containing protein [Actinoplanes oblitus]
MADDDISWTHAAGCFKCRSAGVIRDGDRLLVCAVEQIDGWFLPGGRVQFGESSAAALARELREELGIEFTVPAAPMLVAEGIRDEGGLIEQEVCFYYAISWPDRIPAGSLGDRAGHRFRWVPLAELARVRFLPPEIIGLLQETGGLRHLFSDRRDPGRRR